MYTGSISQLVALGLLVSVPLTSAYAIPSQAAPVEVAKRDVSIKLSAFPIPSSSLYSYFTRNPSSR